MSARRVIDAKTRRRPCEPQNVVDEAKWRVNVPDEVHCGELRKAQLLPNPSSMQALDEHVQHILAAGAGATGGDVHVEEIAFGVEAIFEEQTLEHLSAGRGIDAETRWGRPCI